MIDQINWGYTSLVFLIDLAIRIGLSVRVIMRKRSASVSLAWLVVILLLPFAGAVIYLLFGENRLGDNRARRAAASVSLLEKWSADLQSQNSIDWTNINPECEPIHRQIDTVFSIPATPGNDLQLIDTSDLFFDNLIDDINQAKSFCFFQFYIMSQGGRVNDVVSALLEAAGRGVSCRLLLDSIGSGEFLGNSLVRIMREGGIEVVEALPAGILRSFFVRVDLRNHRKLVVIDKRVAYTGSQNLVDPLFFKQESNVGQWKDTMSRIRGPLVEVMTASFLYDWMLETGETSEYLTSTIFQKPVAHAGNAVVQMLPSGPGLTEDAIHDLLLTTIYAARSELILTTPYFVPDNAILTALKSASLRGVDVTIIVPEKNDSKLVHYASLAMFGELIDAGVTIMLFSKGLLHAKTITIDNDYSLFGSVNLDMRSFWLNFELTLFVYDSHFTKRLHSLQQDYIYGATPLERDTFHKRSFSQRLKENIALLVRPLL